MKNLSVSFDTDAIILSSSGVPDYPREMSVKTRLPPTTYNYKIVMPLETARAIVEAYCKKLADSPEIAAEEDEQLRSLAPALARLLCAIITPWEERRC